MKEINDDGGRIEQARQRVRKTLVSLRTFQAQDTPSRLTEADTKAHFIEPIIAALGWSGIGTVTREYYVSNSQEYIDYVMFGLRPSRNEAGPLLAIEAKAIHHKLTDKHAAQLVQYCAVEGIEWAALTNGRELHFFNTFLRPDLGAKRILKLDLLAFNTDAEFAALFDQLWRLSRDSLTEPSEVRSWLNQLRLDAELRGVLSDPMSPLIQQLQSRLDQADIKATANDITGWFQTHLAPAVVDVSPVEHRPPAMPVSHDSQLKLSDIPDWEKVRGIERWDDARMTLEALYVAVAERWPAVEWRANKEYVAASSDRETFLAAKLYRSYIAVGLSVPKDTRHERLQGKRGRFNWKRITGVVEVRSAGELDSEFLEFVAEAIAQAQRDDEDGQRFYGVTLADLIQAEILRSGSVLVLKAGQRTITEAIATQDGQIEWQGQRYRSPSDRTFASLLGPTRTTLNGWLQWHARVNGVDVSLAELRKRFRKGLPA